MFPAYLLLVTLLLPFIAVDCVKLVKFDKQNDAEEANRGFAICRSRLLTRNRLDIYPDPDDCHSYYRCYFDPAAHRDRIVGVRHHCPPRHFWSTDALKCLPEAGGLPCTDLCRNGTVAVDQGCYIMPRNCARYYKCIDSISQPACCPPQMRFDPDSCSCQRDRANPCLDKCTLPQPLEKTPQQAAPGSWNSKANNTPQPTPHHSALEEVPNYNTTHCEDQFGNTIQALPDHPDSFLVVTLSKTLETQFKPNEPKPEQSDNRFIATCPTGSLFELRSCRCRQVQPLTPVVGDNNDHEPGQISDEPVKPNRQCSLYMPLDSDYDDHSESRNVAYMYDNVELTQTFAARGSGSLLLQGGRVEIPQFSTNVDLRDSASWCLFFQCHSSANSDSHRDPFACLASGGLLSNRLVGSKGLDYSVSIAARPEDQLVARVNFEHPDFVATVNASVNFLSSHAGFNQVCVTYDGSYVTLYVNNILMSKAPATGFVRSTTNTYFLGTDGILGDFHGYIDEVLACRHSLSQAEVNAHFKGQDAMKNAGLVP